jgi:biotin synthase
LLEKCPNQDALPEQIRVSLGTAIVLGLTECKLDAKPTTAYLMTYKTGKWTANCGFCPRARKAKQCELLLSRVTWPTFPTPNVIAALLKAKEGKIRRICIQALNYPDVFRPFGSFGKEIKKVSLIAVSVSCQPYRENIVTLANPV